MPYLFIVQIDIHNEEYKKYLDGTDEVFSKYNGKYLAIDNNATLVEGSWDYNRTVVIEFDTKGDFEKWYYSPGYQKIVKYRLAAAHCDSALIKTLQ